MNGLWEPAPRWTELPGDPPPLRRRLAELRARDSHTDDPPTAALTTGDPR